jgi:hypothetical protein
MRAKDGRDGVHSIDPDVMGRSVSDREGVVFIQPRLEAGALRLDGDCIERGARSALPLMMLAASVVLGAGARFSDRNMQR